MKVHWGDERTKQKKPGLVGLESPRFGFRTEGLVFGGCGGGGAAKIGAFSGVSPTRRRTALSSASGDALSRDTGTPLELSRDWYDGCALPHSKTIPILQMYLREQHGCESIHLGTTYVEELHPDGVKRRLNVEMFELVNAERGRCYGWIDPQEETPVIICEGGSVIGPASAVRSSFAPAPSEASAAHRRR